MCSDIQKSRRLGVYKHLAIDVRTYYAFRRTQTRAGIDVGIDVIADIDRHLDVGTNTLINTNTFRRSYADISRHVDTRPQTQAQIFLDVLTQKYFQLKCRKNVRNDL
jgi:hypothetical protein